MDAIFKALNDPARRALLDSLRVKDGQSLSELEEQLSMTRFGVMKHLKVLEAAHLVVPRKVGRFKYHYLNALPLQEVIDRWVEPLLARPVAWSVLDLKNRLETTMSDKPDFVMMTFINCTHDALWDALTLGEVMSRFHFAADTVQGQHQNAGDQIDILAPDGSPMVSNRLISIDPKSRIAMSFAPYWAPDLEESRCVYVLEPQPNSMKLIIEHYDIPAGQDGIDDGWARFASGLKTFLETGEAHRFTTPARAQRDAG